MPEWPRFPKAPIAEALLDIQAKLSPDVDLARLATFQEAIRDRYPTRRERSSWQAGFEIKAGGSVEIAPSEGRPDGCLFSSTDGRQIVQVRLDGFTFNRLKPYDKWEPFRDEARQHWERYIALTNPSAVSRVALRYINRLELPIPVRDFNEYVLTSPEIAPGLPQGLSGVFMRLEVPYEAFNCTAIITETMEPPQGDILPFIFDVDVYRIGAFETRGEDVWNAFEQLRNAKNEIFFKSITKKAEEMFR